MWRNQELRGYFILLALSVISLTVIGLWMNLYFGLFVILLSGIAALSACLLERRRYRQISRLSDYLDKILSGDFSLDIRSNNEGELSILKSRIYKVAVMLSEQAELLKREKLLLADALSDISHQLKTPLTSMTVMTDLLKEESLPPEKKTAFLNQLHSQLERIEWLVSSLLKLSKLDANVVEFQRKKVPLQELVGKALEPLLIPAELKSQTIVTQNLAGISADVDSRWTAEALLNILKNCIEHTPVGGKIQIYGEENPIYTALYVKDNGEGIADEDIPHIFERFYKGKNSSFDSVGIGLAMAKEIMNKQSGEVAAESVTGEGTTFVLRFYHLKTV